MANEKERAEPEPAEADVERAEAIAEGASSLLGALWHAPEHDESEGAE